MLCAISFFFFQRHDYGIMTMIERDVFMKQMAAGAFKVHCLAVMNEVQSKRESVLITKRGKPVAKLVPVEKNLTTSSIL